MYAVPRLPGVIFAVQGGVAAVVTGVSNIGGAATKTDVSGVNHALEAMSNPAGQIVTAATGSLDKGAKAAALGDLAVGIGNAAKDVSEIKGLIKEGKDVEAGARGIVAAQPAVRGAQMAAEKLHQKDDKKDGDK